MASHPKDGGPNWAWKPERVVRGALRRGERKLDALRRAEKERQAQMVQYRVLPRGTI